MSAAPPPSTSTVIGGRYELQRRLAQGGMAEVWLAIDLTLDRKVAVKWLKPTLATDPVVAERFRREAIAAASLNHPNIVAVHDVFEHEGRQAVVMQLVDGKSLRQLLDTQKRLSPELTCHIGTCVAAALGHAHRAGFVHRDVKPGNIMITPDGRVLLTDFGIAKGLHGGDDLTSDNIMMGTAKYLSPEQVRGKRLDGRADLYSLGLVLYECLAGRVPFLGETDADTALARLQRDPTDLAQLRATLPTGLVNVVHRVLSRNPNHRPATGEELAAALKVAAREGPPAIDPTSDEPTPFVTPLAAGRLRRAPSAVRPVGTTSPPGAADDRSPEGTIPGEPPGIRTRVGGDDSDHDHTPTAARPLRGRPAKGLVHERRTSTIFVAVAVAVALAVAGLLWFTLRFGGGETSSPTTVLPDGGTEVSGAETDGAESPPSPTSAPPPAQASIAAVTAFDPDGDATENDADAALVIDGDPTTPWRTLCYSSQYMGGKRGVGLVVTFESPVRSGISVEVGSAPYQVQFYASDADIAPASIDGWGPVLGERVFDDEPGTVVSARPEREVRHVLVLLNELGPDDGCTTDNPYRGTLDSITATG